MFRVVSRLQAQKSSSFLRCSSAVRFYGLKSNNSSSNNDKLSPGRPTYTNSEVSEQKASDISAKNSGQIPSAFDEPGKLTKPVTKDAHFGLNGYIERVNNTAIFGMFGTLSVGTGCAMILPSSMLLPATIIGFIGSFGCTFWIEALKSQVKVEETKNGLRSIQPQQRIFAFASLVGSMGVGLSSFMDIMIATDPYIAPVALGLTLATLGATNMYTRYRQISDKTFASMEICVTTGIFSTLSLGAVAIVVYPFYPEITASLHNIDIYLGIPFWAFTSAYTFAAARRSYIAGKPDYIGEATQLYLDGLNLMLRIMEAMAKAKSKK